MTHTKLLLHDAAREKLLRGATALADAVRVTLGPRSKSVLIEREYGAPIVCDDGVTIAKAFSLKDHEENLGARMLREAATRTGERVGDGTTTATLLAHALFAEGLRNVVAGASAIELKRGIERGSQLVVQVLRSLSRPTDTRARRAQVATVSAHDDGTIGERVAEAMEKVGADGVVSLEEAKGTETSLEVVEGLQFDQGYLSPYFVTGTEKMEAVLEEALILLHDKRISSTQALLPVLEKVVKLGRPLLVLCEQVEGDALATLVVNKLRGTFACAAAKAPGYGDRRKAMLEDFAILTGGQVTGDERGITLETLAEEDLGRAKRVVLTRETTTIIGGGGDRAAIQARCAELRRQLELATSDYEREKLAERLAKLSGGVAVIRVGAPSEAELKRLKEAYEDAIAATKAAVAEGIVPGGGVALLRAIPAVQAAEREAQGDERTGLRVLARALEAPARQIAANSGFDPGVIVERLGRETGTNGFDARSGRFVDLFEAGILDPTRVVRLALENAVSVAGTLLLAEATLTQIEDEGPARRKHGEESFE
ncbi:MAG: chaperonin GroEL [Planctomycetes bacterium]|nr:chaperonin GroEL [Planctomycetota bacterium]